MKMFMLISGANGVLLMMIPCALTVWLELPVFWVFMGLVPDYVVKAILLVWRFRSGRWQTAIH